MLRGALLKLYWVLCLASVVLCYSIAARGYPLGALIGTLVSGASSRAGSSGSFHK
jgi:hypothetical protein